MVLLNVAFLLIVLSLFSSSYGFTTPLCNTLRPSFTRSRSVSSLFLFGGKKDKEGGATGGGGMGGMGNMMEQFKKAQEIAKRTAQMQEELGKTTVEGKSASGAVTVALNGQQKPLSVNLSSFEGADAEQLSNDVKEAMQEAHQKSMQLMSEKMAGLYAELGLPGAGGGAPPAP